MEWIPIDVRRPPQDTYVLVVIYDYREKVKMSHIQIASRIGDAYIDDKDGELLKPKYGYVTHWMPIPDAPKD